MRHNLRIWPWLLPLLLVSCAPEEKRKAPPGLTAPAEKEKKDPPFVQLSPPFNEDSAYFFIEQQVALGPRVPGTKSHRKCADYLEKQFRTFGLEVSVQRGKARAYNGVELEMLNIMASYRKENPDRIALFAHWDTRPYADRDHSNRTHPIDGANDGGSGVGVLLEIARVIHREENKPGIGIDFVLFDAEDYGQPSETMIGQKSDTWCLGSQYWSRNLPYREQKPRFGILLDMVGAKDAVFPQDWYSRNHAPDVVENVWGTAYRLGYGSYFSKIPVGGLTDDHLYVNTLAKIPTIDIVHYDPKRSDFGEFHHTHKDNMAIIDRKTLRAVGQTVLEVVYRE